MQKEDKNKVIKLIALEYRIWSTQSCEREARNLLEAVDYRQNMPNILLSTSIKQGKFNIAETPKSIY